MADINQIFSTKQAKVILTIGSFVIIGYILFSVIVTILSVFYELNPLLTIFIISAKDFFQILFFIVVATVGVLSYIRAKETLFTPIKTETFKMQISAFEDILAFFQSKIETDFTHQFDFDFIVNANGRIMFSEFIEHFYSDEISIKKDKLKELHSDFVGGVFTQTWAENNLSSPEYFEKTEIQKPEKPTNAAIILERWKKYEYGPIQFSKKYQENTEKLNQLIASPLIPSELKLKLEKFNEIVHENLFTVGKVLNTIAQELPDKFPTAKSIEKIEPAGIWNLYNKEKKDMEGLSNEILKYIRDYLKIDLLIK